MKRGEKMGMKLTPEMLSFLRINALKHDTIILTDLLNKEFNVNITVKKVRQTLFDHDIPFKKMVTKYTQEMIEFLRGNALKYDTGTLAKLFNKKFNANITSQKIRDIMYSHNISFIKSKPKVTPLTLPIGHEVIERRRNITYIKISNEGRNGGAWVRKHRFLWEQVHGIIPKGYIVIFLDKNNFNFELGNLELVKPIEFILLNKYGFHSTDKEITKAGLAVVRHRLAAFGALTKGMSGKEKESEMNKFYKREQKRAKKPEGAKISKE